MVEIIPAILTNDVQEVGKLISIARGVVERVQIDIIDGEFADNKTVLPEDMKDVDLGELKLDFHLMVKEPVEWVERCANFGDDRVIGQVEMMKNQKEFTDKVRQHQLVAGLALDVDTPIEKLENKLLDNLGVVLLMSVKAGFGGQKFDIKVLEKIRELKDLRYRSGTNFSICDDGGITLQLIDDAHYVGADEVSMGRRLFKGDLKKNIQDFQKSAHTFKKQ